MQSNFKKRVIHLDPHEVQDETLAALEAEIRDQTDDELGEIESIDTVVLDSNTDLGGLDSHATVFTKINDNHE